MEPESCVPLIVTHYHFSVWPDHGVPVDKTSLIHFIQRVRRHHPFFNSSPLLVHCSAGVGRTGTFITLDSMIHMMKTETTLDILPFIRRMRNNRPLMVQTEVRVWGYNYCGVTACTLISFWWGNWKARCLLLFNEIVSKVKLINKHMQHGCIAIYLHGWNDCKESTCHVYTEIKSINVLCTSICFYTHCEPVACTVI